MGSAFTSDIFPAEIQMGVLAVFSVANDTGLITRKVTLISFSYPILQDVFAVAKVGEINATKQKKAHCPGFINILLCA